MTRQARTLSSLLEHSRFQPLDTLAELLQGLARELLGGSDAGLRLKSWLNGTPIRHRIHPLLVTVPIGAWTTAALLDALARRSNGHARSGYRSAADAATGLGIVSALPTALTGVADWVDLYDHPRRVGVAHALANTAALTCYTVSWGMRRSGNGSRTGAEVLSTAGFLFLTIGGSLGGELVYTLGFNVPHTIYPKPPNEWVDVIASDELPQDTPVVRDAGRVPVLLLRHDDTVFAVEAWCPHAGGPLNEGTFEGDVVECPWHQSRFCLTDGRPLQGPASVPLRTFEVRERAGRVEVRPSYESQSWPPPPED